MNTVFLLFITQPTTNQYVDAQRVEVEFVEEEGSEGDHFEECVHTAWRELGVTDMEFLCI